MTEPAAYQIDRSHIIFEQFEDETVVVNTETGYYYSLSNSGSEILHLIEDRTSMEELAVILFGNSQVSPADWDLVEKFIAELAAEKILIARTPDQTEAQPGPAPQPPRTPLFGPAGEFIPPVLERFDDVRDLLLIDPIHQVDQDYGWPKAMGNGSKLG